VNGTSRERPWGNSPLRDEILPTAASLPLSALLPFGRPFPPGISAITVFYQRLFLSASDLKTELSLLCHWTFVFCVMCGCLFLNSFFSLPILLVLVLLLSLLQASNLMGYPFWEPARCIVLWYWYCIFALVNKNLSLAHLSRVTALHCGFRLIPQAYIYFRCSPGFGINISQGI